MAVDETQAGLQRVLAALTAVASFLLTRLEEAPRSIPILHFLLLAALMAILAGSSDVGRAAEPPTGAAILQQLRSFATMGSVLYIAAHPEIRVA